MAISAFSLARPEMEQLLADPAQKPAEWDWCATDAFDGTGLDDPWGQGTITEGVDISQSLCSDGKGTWVLYHKVLTSEDRKALVLKKENSSGNDDEEEGKHPYFALYNPYTGVLRTFLWVGENTNLSSNASNLVIRARIAAGESTEPTHLLDYYVSPAMPSLAQAPTAVDKYWVFNTPHNNKWYILDLFLTYDPNEYLGEDGYQKQLNILFEMEAQDSIQFSLSGTLTDSTGKDNTLDWEDYYNAGKEMVSTVGDGVQDVMKEYRSTPRMGKNLLADLDSGKYAFIKDWDLGQTLGKFAEKMVNRDGLVSYLPAAMEAIAPMNAAVGLVQSLFSTSTTSSIHYFNGKLNLKGFLFVKSSPNSYKIPYSGSVLSTAPLYAFGKRASDRKLGLFHLRRWPATRDNYKDSLIEPLSCLVLMNPTSRAKAVDEFYALGQQEKGMETLYNKVYFRTYWKGMQAALSFADTAADFKTARERRLELMFTTRRQPGVEAVDSWPGVIGNLSGNGVEKTVCLEHLDENTQPFAWSQLPDGFALGAEVLTLNDRVHVYNQGGGDGAVLAWKKAQLGVDASVGELWSLDQVDVRERAMVWKRLVAARLSGQNIGTNVLPDSVEPSAAASFPARLRVARLFETDPLVGYASAELNGACQLYNLSRVEQNPPYCDTSLVDTSWASYWGFVRADREAKTPVWCKVDDSGPYGYLRARAAYYQPSCQQAANYEPINYEKYVQSRIGTRLVLPPGYYSHVVVRSGYTLVLDSGLYHIGHWVMDSGSKLELKSGVGYTDIEVDYNWIWRGEMRPQDADRIRLAYLGPYQTLFLETSFHGTVVAPASKLVLGQHTGCVYYGRYFAKELEIHQGTVIVSPFKTGDSHEKETVPAVYAAGPVLIDRL